MKTWIFNETKNLVKELKKDFEDPSINNEWKQKIKTDLQVAAVKLDSQKQAKAA